MAIEEALYVITETISVTWTPDVETIVCYPFYSPRPGRRVVIESVRFMADRVANTPGRPVWTLHARSIAFRHIRKDGTYGPIVTQDAGYDYTREIPGAPAAMAQIVTHLNDSKPVPSAVDTGPEAVA